ncbi:MAG TPA: tRNA 2-thiouridine(34) synthase MnmA, partial [Saprospiraceae bacterium]|nr:tRNA 2-thiouridine(34) synthase MnmA [Saprospiraceae bacterium]
FYTIGQRKGLGMAFGEPMFVTEIRPETNTVVLGRLEELIRNGMTVGQVNPMKYAQIPEGIEAVTRIRYKDRGTLSRLSNIGDDKVFVDFFANVSGVAPGQSAVFYEGDDVIGGGVIYGNGK